MTCSWSDTDPRSSKGMLDVSSSAHVLAAPESLPIVEGDIRPGSRLLRPFEILSSGLLVTIIVLLLAGVISRYLFSLPVVWIDEVASLCFLWLAMLGSAIALDRNEHLRLTLRCSFRSSAIADPSIASHRKQSDATSSIHTTGSENR